MSGAWTVPTYASAHPDAATTPVACGCGRVVSPDMLTDVTALTPAKRTAIGWTATTDYVCDSCMAMAERTGALTRSTLYAKQGAPSDVLDRVRAVEATL